MTGNAIYVYCILAAGLPQGEIVATDLSFILDDVHSQVPFQWDPNSTTPHYTYNYPVYANTNIGTSATGASGLHNLTVLSFQAVLFDYAVYTYVVSNPSMYLF